MTTDEFKAIARVFLKQRDEVERLRVMHEGAVDGLLQLARTISANMKVGGHEFLLFQDKMLTRRLDGTVHVHDRPDEL